MQIVKVRYYSETSKECIGPREYSYYSVDELTVGDIVTVPIRDATGKAQVFAIDVPESEIEAFKDKVKTIPSKIPSGGLAEAAELAGVPVKVVDLADTKPAIDIATEKMDVAIININPRSDLAVIQLIEGIDKLGYYAMTRVITKDEDISPITDDLTIIAKLKKALTEKRDEYTKPIDVHLENIKAVFNPLIALLKEAEQTNKAKIMAYTDAQKARAAEADRLNREALELARKQNEFSGEHTVDLTTLVAPAPVHKVSTQSGSISEVKAPSTWEIENEDLIPKEYWILDALRISRIVRAGGSIPGIRVITHTGIRTNTK